MLTDISLAGMIFAVSSLAATLISISVLLWVKRAFIRSAKNNEQLVVQLNNAEQRVHQLEQELGALCSASVGAGGHVVRLEQQMLRITERQNLVELRASSERPYTQASQLIHKGAKVDDLVDNCGLTQGEAELLCMMQRGNA